MKVADAAAHADPVGPTSGGPPAGRQSDSGADAPGLPTEVATYELARDELAAVVSKLESGGLSLDESLTLWERGEFLAAVCSRFLDGARQRVETALAEAQGKD